MKPRTKTLLALSIVPQIILVKTMSFFPGFIEAVYSNGLYFFISKLMRLVFGWLPFSFGDLVYTLAGIYLIRWIIKHRWRVLKDTKNWIRDILVAVSMLYFAFHLLWGMNYYRKPLHQMLELDDQYSTEELLDVIDKLTVEANAIHRSLVTDDSLKVTVPYTKKELLDKSVDGYENLRKTYPTLYPGPKSVKRSLYSIPLTYMGFSGYLNPFTNEAQIDHLIPLHKYPSTACHEQAHQIGYAAENEANFVGFLAASFNDDPYFRYSAYIFALKHCLFEIARRDLDQFETLKENVNLGILKNYEEERLFWMSYQNPLEPIFKETFNTFLKANNQADGIKSYSYVVALLVNYFKQENP